MATITIPLEQAREGDRVTITMGQTVMSGPLVHERSALRLGGTNWTLDGIDSITTPKRVTIQRDVPDLPTEPGAVFRATVDGLPGVQLMFAPGGERDATPYASYPAVHGLQWHAPGVIDPETVELATITWGAEA